MTFRIGFPLALAAAVMLSGCDSKPAKPAAQQGAASAAGPATATGQDRPPGNDEVSAVAQVTAIKDNGNAGYTVSFASNNGAVTFELPADAKTLAMAGGPETLKGKWVTVYHNAENRITWLKARPAP